MCNKTFQLKYLILLMLICCKFCKTLDTTKVNKKTHTFDEKVFTVRNTITRLSDIFYKQFKTFYMVYFNLTTDLRIDFKTFDKFIHDFNLQGIMHDNAVKLLVEKSKHHFAYDDAKLVKIRYAHLLKDKILMIFKAFDMNNDNFINIIEFYHVIYALKLGKHFDKIKQNVYRKRKIYHINGSKV